MAGSQGQGSEKHFMVSVLPLSPVSTQLLNLTLELTLPSDLKDTDFDCFIQGDNEICL